MIRNSHEKNFKIEWKTQKIRKCKRKKYEKNEKSTYLMAFNFSKRRMTISDHCLCIKKKIE